MKYIFPILCFSFMLSLAQYDSYLYSVTFFMGIAYVIHKLTDGPKEEDG